MKMNTNRLALLVIGLLFTMIFLSSVSAQTVSVGVSKGETFDYSCNIAWTSTNPAATPPSDALEYNNTQKVQLRITDIAGSTINVDVLISFKNGSQKTESGTIDIEHSNYTVPFGFLIVGANIAKGQPIYPAGGQVVTDTVMRSYPSGQRETNLISAENSNQKITTYFDKIKGVAVDYSHTVYDIASDDYSITSTEQMVSTNSEVWITSVSSPTTLTPTSDATATPTQTHATSTPSTDATVSPIPTGGGVHSVTESPQSASDTCSSLSNGIMIGGIIVVVIVGLAVVVLVVLKRRKPRKEKKDAEVDFDLSGWHLK
jgi:hypothetical protein